MRVLLLGSTGQVGSELARTLLPIADVIAPVRPECDAADLDSLAKAFRTARPDVVINAAAYAAVDRAEDEPALARAVNAEAPGLLARLATQHGASLIHYSTDYVFDGTKSGEYVEDDVPVPLSVYGRTKLEGETLVRESGCAHLIFRTSWVYAAHGHNFVRTMLRLAREKQALSVVDDQVGSPTWARAIAEATAVILARAGHDRASVAASFAERGGLFHMTSAGAVSWFGFAKAIFDAIPDNRRALQSLTPIPAAQYPLRAVRPANSRLCCERLARTWHVALPDWKSSLQLAAREFRPA
jgi:dTDP-4-dehydrorhamnose reductase